MKHRIARAVTLAAGLGVAAAIAVPALTVQPDPDWTGGLGRPAMAPGSSPTHVDGGWVYAPQGGWQPDWNDSTPVG
jgi:hypothetical protein